MIHLRFGRILDGRKRGLIMFWVLYVVFSLITFKLVLWSSEEIANKIGKELSIDKINFKFGMVELKLLAMCLLPIVNVLLFVLYFFHYDRVERYFINRYVDSNDK